MKKHTITANPWPEKWRSFLDGFVSGNLAQTFEYGEVVKMSNPRTKVLRLSAIDRNSYVGIVQAVFNARFGFSGSLDVGGWWGFGPVARLGDEGYVLRVAFLLERLCY